MSIDKKIAELMEESDKLKETEVVAEETTEEVVMEAKAKAKANEEDEMEEEGEDEIKEEDEEDEEETEMNEMKVDVSEDVDALMNGEELSEEFKAKATTIFEAAVVTRVKGEVAKLEEKFDAQLTEQVEEIKEGLIDKVDGYLNYVVEQWISDNELALENGLKNEIFESFVGGMKNLFAEHYIEVPEEKFDVLGDLEEQLNTFETKLDEQLDANVALKKELNNIKRDAVIKENFESMTETDKEKFLALAEDLSFENEETFAAKLQTIKENYFGKKQSKQTITESFITDTPVAEETEAPKVTGSMAHYLNAINSSKRF